MHTLHFGYTPLCFPNPVSLCPQNSVHLSSLLPSLNSSSPVETQLSLATPAEELCPPWSHHSALLTDTSRGSARVPSPCSLLSGVLNGAQRNSLHVILAGWRV